MLSAEHTSRPISFRPRSPYRRGGSPKMGSTQINASEPEQFEHIFLITGPAGCGKTTVAQHLAKTLNWPYVEGDDVRLILYHVVETNANTDLVPHSGQ